MQLAKAESVDGRRCNLDNFYEGLSDLLELPCLKICSG